VYSQSTQSTLIELSELTLPIDAPCVSSMLILPSTASAWYLHSEYAGEYSEYAGEYSEYAGEYSEYAVSTLVTP
jgi:hypothetical protein